eukprot:CAMPEP_0179298750 /NCGR_PEP_ID=MMETSP0797-20121207/46154_1 /TAXON_ID=47934 /ORGANISM="Dinophysis acuminata, Strain DAEP01" /LENGTH=360 /DNA_ID=CAMNT_0021008147 /DNA_START=1 /DNA_END=1080 /DNA_ORIENTATION=+
MAASVLVTGVSGFVGSWCVKTFLDNGYKVIGTVRDPASRKCDFLRRLPGAERLQLVGADLVKDPEDKWRSVVRGCHVVVHTAGPFTVENVPKGKEEEFFMEPLLRGTETVLRACIAEGVNRVVFTSSAAAIEFGHSPESDPQLTPPGVDERNWTNEDGLLYPEQWYVKAKTVAERRAWELVKGTSLQLAVVNPGLVLGPFLSLDTASGSITTVRALLKKEYPACPDIPLTCVDVRDVAKMHFLAATTPGAAGKRHLCVSTPVSVSFLKMAHYLDEAGFDVPTGRLPDVLVRATAMVDRKLKLLLPVLGKKKYANPINGNQLIGGNWIDVKTSLRDQATSMMELGKIGRYKKDQSWIMKLI